MIEGKLLGPLRPDVPSLKPGGKYLVEVVVRTLGVGHLFSQGTVDSNEIWVELIARSGDRVIGRSGGIGPDGTVDPYSHFINVYMLDRDGNRIDRRNPQDIFVPLYNKQIPPGAGQVVHFALEVPRAMSGPITLEAKVNYRKFDRTYLDYIFGKGKGPELPVVVMARDQVSLPIAGGPPVANDPSPIEATWQRWNDYGIGLFLEGATKGGQKGELKQAEVIFTKVAELGRADGWVNLARVYQREGRIPDALAALEKAANHKEPAAPWVINWLTGQINASNGLLDEAIASFESVLATRIPDRKFDFSTDYRVINDLGATFYARARIELPVTTPRGEITSRRRSPPIGAPWPSIPKTSAPTGAWPRLTAIRPGASRQKPSRPPKSAAGADVESRTGRTRSTLDARRPRSPIPRRPQAERRSLALRLGRDIERFMSGPRPRYQSRLEPLHDVVAILGPAWDRPRPTRRRRPPWRKPLKVAHRQLARTAQARRDRRGPGVCPGPPARPRRQPERAVDRDPSAAPPGRAGNRSAGRDDRPDTIARNHDRRPGLGPGSGVPEMTIGLVASLREVALGLRSVLLVPCGCSPGTATPVLPKALAPVRPVAVKAESLPTVKFVDITKEAGIHFVHNNGAFGDKLLPETMGSGVAFLDYDRDGDQDLFFVNSSYWPGHESQAGAHPGPLPQRRQGPLSKT